MATRIRAAAAKKAAPPFPVSTTSPFPDKYDIEGERSALADLIQMEDFDKVTLDPRYERYMELERREELLRKRQGRSRPSEWRRAGSAH
ncbi:MAG: hypothetical protein QM750_19650 [Rubrivivax sp.]